MAQKKIHDLKPDPRNANRHSEYGTGLLENSTRFNGLGRSILISNDDVIIAGNGVFEAAGAIGINKLKIIETDGTELIAVKRTDIKSGTAEFSNMALADNIVATKNIVMDAEVIEGIVEDFPEVKVWADIVLETKKERAQDGREDLTKVIHEFSPEQYGDYKKAIKIARKEFGAQFQEAENDREQSNCLAFILKDWLKNRKK